MRKTVGQTGNGGFADAAFRAGDGDDFAHVCDALLGREAALHARCEVGRRAFAREALSRVS